MAHDEFMVALSDMMAKARPAIADYKRAKSDKQRRKAASDFIEAADAFLSKTTDFKVQMGRTVPNFNFVVRSDAR